MNAQARIPSGAGRRQDGFAVITAMAFVFLMSLVTAGLFALGRQQLHTALRTRDFLKARLIAEAGANAAYNDVRTNFARIANFTGQAVTYDDGAYRVWITTNGVQGVVGNDCAILISTGSCGQAAARVGMSLRNFGESITTGSGYVNSLVLSNAVAAAGKLTGRGTMTITGNASSMTAIDMGGSSLITGVAYAPVLKGKSENFPGGTSTDPAHYTFNVNNIIDYAAYRNAAVVWDGRADFSTYPAGTIVFCEVGSGNVNISQQRDEVIRCCIISTGGFKIQAQTSMDMRIEQTGGYPALITLNGDINLHGGVSITGIIIAKSPTASSKNTGGGGRPVNITGCFITAGPYDGGGNWDIAGGSAQLTYSPGQTIMRDGVVVMAYQ